MKPMTTQMVVHEFIELVNYYCDMWESNLHRLQPLTNLTPNKEIIKFTDIKHKSFDKIKRIIAWNNLFANIEFNK